MHVDAIVNTANPHAIIGSGVDSTIHYIGSVHKYARKEDVPKTLFIITTDSMENVCHYYTYDQVSLFYLGIVLIL